MNRYIGMLLFLYSSTVYSQGTKFTCELYANPAFTKTWIPDQFSPPFGSSIYTLIFGKGNPDIGIFGYNYGVSIGVLLKDKIELQLTYSKALKGQRNSIEHDPIDNVDVFGKYTEFSDELILSMKFMKHSIFNINRFNYLIGIILSHYSLITAGYYVYYNDPAWTEPSINSRADISEPNLIIFRPGITTEIEYQLLTDNIFTFTVGLKFNHYFSSFNIKYPSDLAARPRGYALTIGPSFKLKYQL